MTTRLIVTACAHTLFLGRARDGAFEGFAAGVVPPTHPTLVLLLRGADRAVAAHFLFMRTWKV